jgi:hypothetical protein
MLCNESLNLEHFKFIRIIELVIQFRTFSFTIIVNLSIKIFSGIQRFENLKN